LVELARISSNWLASYHGLGEYRQVNNMKGGETRMEKKVDQSQKYEKPMLVTHAPLRNITADGSNGGTIAPTMAPTTPSDG